MKIIEHKGRWVPEGSEKAWNRYWSRTGDMLDATLRCKHNRAAVQAGGNIGAWPIWLSKRFKEVLTFEPEPVNFECLIKNLLPYKNVEPYHAALGAECGYAELVVCRSIGSHHLKAGTSAGKTQVLSIDSFNLEHCDLIVLDIEGFEYEALQGALDTIARCKPIIQFEERGHGVKKGNGKGLGDIYRLLPEYEVVNRIRHDIVMGPK